MEYRNNIYNFTVYLMSKFRNIESNIESVVAVEKTDQIDQICRFP